METKLSAVRAYRSQVALLRWDEAIMGLNRYRGLVPGAGEFAEAFSVIAAPEDRVLR